MAWMTDIGPHWCPVEFANWEGFTLIWTQAMNWLAGKQEQIIGNVRNSQDESVDFVHELIGYSAISKPVLDMFAISC